MTEIPPDDTAWIPSAEFIKTTNVAWLMNRAGVDSYGALHAWSVHNREAYWAAAIERLGLRFAQPYSRVADFSQGVEAPRWLPGARMNIVESCFRAPADSPAIIHQAEGGPLQIMSVAELENLTQRVAANLQRLGFQPGDAIAIIMPMTAECVAIYLGIIAAGCAVVGIADSFRPKEIATRLRIASAKAIFTRDVMVRGGKKLPLYSQVIEAEAPRAIVLPASAELDVPLRAGDLSWADFLSGAERCETVIRDPADAVNILFSSGTTGDPKAIPWTQTTPLKCAADAHFHQNVQPGDVLVWPTNIGWMMGPWLIFASLLNRAAMGLYDGTPICPEFGRFVQESGATMLGVVPSLVKAWRATGCMDASDWTGLKLFSSTGECSNVDDMHWLMSRAGGRPVIEYCGGTEIGGGYITSTVTRPCRPGLFNTPTLGLDVVILDEEGAPAERGELFLVPPSIGMSNTLLNQDHHAVYFAGTPRGPHGEVLRRHGDQMEALPGAYWRGQGRADDTMNLGGIKVSSAEIERVLQAVPGVVETAAIAVSACGGPSALVIYTVCSPAFSGDRSALLAAMQSAIRSELNPLFKIHDLVIIETLPRTASNKVMRRVLRDRYASNR
jgi:acetyl-CoA synthetase